MHSNNNDDYELLDFAKDKLEIGKIYFSREWGYKEGTSPRMYGQGYVPHTIVAKSRPGIYGDRVMTSNGRTLYQTGHLIGRHQARDYDKVVLYRLKDVRMKPHVQLSLFAFEE